MRARAARPRGRTDTNQVIDTSQTKQRHVPPCMPRRRVLRASSPAISTVHRTRSPWWRQPSRQRTDWSRRVRFRHHDQTVDPGQRETRRRDHRPDDGDPGHEISLFVSGRRAPWSKPWHELSLVRGGQVTRDIPLRKARATVDAWELAENLENRCESSSAGHKWRRGRQRVTTYGERCYKAQ